MMNRRAFISRLVSKSLRKNHRISIVPTKRPPNFLGQPKKEYINFNQLINNTIDELSMEILSQVEACAWDYSDHFISLHFTNPAGDEVIHVVHEPETESTQTYDSSSLTDPKIHQ
jgi:ribulose bisphosphate carboxylase small subunit